MITVTNLSKQFDIPIERRTTLKESLLSLHRPQKSRILNALNNVSFSINSGESFGIIGDNGSGKSTLLKILANVYQPTSGEVDINGKISPLLELGIGFNEEMSGKENVALNGAILGITRAQLDDLYPQIVAFSGLDDFMSLKVKNYSSGMKMRLAFSIAVHVDADIYLCDEVLAVGDKDFQQKCHHAFADLKAREKTIVMVTHDLEAVKKYCDRAILMDRGEVSVLGAPAEVIEKYLGHDKPQA